MMREETKGNNVPTSYLNRPHCYVVTRCIILVSVNFFPQDNASSNTIATGSKITGNRRESGLDHVQ